MSGQPFPSDEKAQTIYKECLKYRTTLSNVGYWKVYAPDCPYGEADGRVQWTHFLAWKLNFHLNKSDIVHHNDENTWNDNPSNLTAMSRSEHAQMHILTRKRPPSFTFEGNSHSKESRNRIAESTQETFNLKAKLGLRPVPIVYTPKEYHCSICDKAGSSSRTHGKAWH